MKTKSFIRCLICFIALFQLAQAETIRLASGEWAPYTSEKLKHHGVFSHIVTEAFAMEGIEVEYQYFPWTRSYKLAKEGELDGSLAWAPNEERKQDFYFSDPVIRNQKVFFHLKSFPFDWNSIDDLQDLKVGITREYTYGEAFDQAVKDKRINATTVNQDKQNIKKLMLGRIDIFPVEIDVGYSLVFSELTPAQTPMVTNHSKPILDTPYCLVLSKKMSPVRADRLLNIFNQGLKKLKESGQYEQWMWNSRQGKYLAE